MSASLICLVWYSLMKQHMNTKQFILKLVKVNLPWQQVGKAMGFIKGRAPGKLTGCKDDFACLVSPSSGEFFL